MIVLQNKCNNNYVLVYTLLRLSLCERLEHGILIGLPELKSDVLTKRINVRGMFNGGIISSFNFVSSHAVVPERPQPLYLLQYFLFLVNDHRKSNADSIVRSAMLIIRYGFSVIFD